MANLINILITTNREGSILNFKEDGNRKHPGSDAVLPSVLKCCSNKMNWMPSDIINLSLRECMAPSSCGK